jgi:tetratricopeptide (TPR) repeat protein
MRQLDAATRPFIVVALALATTACASRNAKPTVPQAAILNRADALVREGCYGCLSEAIEAYEAVLAAGRRVPERALRGAFDATLLRAIREKEIGVPSAATLQRAHVLFERLSARGSAAPATSRRLLSARLEAADLVEGELGGLDVEARTGHDQREPALTEKATALLQSLPRDTSDLTSEYVAMAVLCELPSLQRLGRSTPAVEREAAPRLLQYRLAVCARDNAVLDGLALAGTKWGEAAFFRARFELSNAARAPDPELATRLLDIAHAAFPESSAIDLLMARTAEMIGDSGGALESFERVLTRAPGHLDARVGRIRALTALERRAEAIEAATALLQGGTWYVGDAYYWRAMNRYALGESEAAWTDVQQALQRLANTAVHSLAGSIAYRQRDLTRARAHFEQAFAMDRSHCAAAASAALVTVDQAAWRVAIDWYTQAADCFSRAAVMARRELADLEAGPASASAGRRRAAALKRAESAELLAAETSASARALKPRLTDPGASPTHEP